MNMSLIFTGAHESLPQSEREQTASDFVDVMKTARFNRDDTAAYDGIESWVSDTYGAPPAGPFTERASGLLRDNSPEAAMRRALREPGRFEYHGNLPETPEDTSGEGWYR